MVARIFLPVRPASSMPVRLSIVPSPRLHRVKPKSDRRTKKPLAKTDTESPYRPTSRSTFFFGIERNRHDRQTGSLGSQNDTRLRDPSWSFRTIGSENDIGSRSRRADQVAQRRHAAAGGRSARDRGIVV